MLNLNFDCLPPGGGGCAKIVLESLATSIPVLAAFRNP